MESKMVTLSVISPMYNEEKVIASSIKRMHEKLSSSKYDFEMIIVDDGSLDKSRVVAERFAKNYSNVKIVGYDVNGGRGKALREGFKHASGELIVTIESDSTWGENIVIKMADVLRKDTKYDMVIASPHRSKIGYVNVPAYRVLVAKFGNKLLAKAFGSGVTMATGMTRAYRREVIDSLLLTNDKKEIHLEILSKALMLGYKVTEVPARITWKKKKKNKKGRKSSFNLKRLLYTHLVFTLNESPIMLIGTVSSLFILLGIISAGIILNDFLAGNFNPGRPLIYFMITMLIVGIQTLIFSLIAYKQRDNYRQSLLTQKLLLEIKRGLKK